MTDTKFALYIYLVLIILSSALPDPWDGIFLGAAAGCLIGAIDELEKKIDKKR